MAAPAGSRRSSRCSRAAPKVIEAWEQPARPARADAIPVGARVFHQKFGYGSVTAVDDDRLDIAFEQVGQQARAGSVRGEGVTLIRRATTAGDRRLTCPRRRCPPTRRRC